MTKRREKKELIKVGPLLLLPVLPHEKKQVVFYVQDFISFQGELQYVLVAMLHLKYLK